VSAWVNVALLHWTLHRRAHLTIDRRLRARLPRLALATAAMAGVLLLLNGWIDPLMARGIAERAIGLALLFGAGGVTYFAIAFALGALSLADLRAQLSRRRPA
jgi:putative peptidoglycan lipid II flippase